MQISGRAYIRKQEDGRSGLWPGKTLLRETAGKILLILARNVGS